MRGIILLLVVLVAGCGPTRDEQIRVASAACAYIKESEEFQSAQRVDRVNQVRMEFGLPIFTEGDDSIKESIENGSCVALMLNLNETIKRNYKNGRPLIEMTYKNGKLDGVRRRWHENGVLMAEIPYKDGKQDGIERFWDGNGQLRNEVTYKDGMKEGAQRIYDESGMLLVEIQNADNIEIARVRFQDVD